MILHLLAPDSEMINKGKQEQWQAIEGNLSPILFQAAVDAKAEEYTWHLATIITELATLVDQEQASGRYYRKHSRGFLHSSRKQ